MVLLLLDLAVIVDCGAFLRLFIHVELVALITVHLVSLQVVAIAFIFHLYRGPHSSLMRGQKRGIY